MPPDSVADLVPVRQPPCPLPLTFSFYCLSQPGRHPAATPTRGNSRGQGNRQVCPGLSFLRVQISGPRPNSLWAKLLMSSVKLALWDQSAHCHPEQLHRSVTHPASHWGWNPGCRASHGGEELFSLSILTLSPAFLSSSFNEMPYHHLQIKKKNTQPVSYYDWSCVCVLLQVDLN